MRPSIRLYHYHSSIYPSLLLPIVHQSVEVSRTFRVSFGLRGIVCLLVCGLWFVVCGLWFVVSGFGLLVSGFRF
ncbi:hypothetical protein T484DRAFT_1980315 [Baffinella frigidus]|nr:hypothetical protein T484DRAFT_1980315 [Cryptophyta sp. CCMP2293]